jgi:hypothetical protein
MTIRVTILASCLVAFGSICSAHASDCVLHVKRAACAGQETECFKKCDGKSECDEAKDTAASEAACMKEAETACAVNRPDITKYKTVTATFKGQPLIGGFSAEGKIDAKGANFCSGDRPDANKCK